MKKILFVAPSLRVGGMERVLVTLANRLVESEYDVTVLLIGDDDSMRAELDSRVRVNRKLSIDHPGKHIPYIRYKLYDDIMWEERATPRQLYRYFIGSAKYDVEIAFFRGLCVKIISGSTNQNAVHLAWVHSEYRHISGWKQFFRSLEMVRESYTCFHKVVCVSEQAKQSFIETIGDTGNLTCIYNMLPVNEIRCKAEDALPTPMPDAGLKTVIVARLEDKAKGLLRLIEAFSRLHDEGADISLTIVGSGEDEERIRKLIAEKNASSYIALAGLQRNPFPYIKAADLLLCSSFFEGYNLTVAEALILGTPVLSTDCTGPNEILDGGKYGMIVENSTQGLYEGLKKLSGDPALLAEYRAKAARRLDFFDEERILKQITALWGE